ncbi:phosphoglucomutase [Cephaloticoccus primus]|uniref:Phosphoglucomutase n=1 Tax=Cephaloticoccus primus TaxID=1548207 RepID=A0A139SST5_9BACT|nr:phospho-sugar mutase [Cephaloticoccus primus]KXU37594.1 phosphoglucomutase [Cephaloticoccus primus]
MTLLEKLETAAAEQKLLPTALENLKKFLAAGLPAWAQESIGELVDAGQWAELNDRFYAFISFGTGGMRGRTIGKVSTAAERGETGADHAAIGSNLLNDFTLLRAVIGLYRYTQRYLAEGASAPAAAPASTLHATAAGASHAPPRPRLVVAHDVRHFSRHFCELAASTWVKLGGEALIFDGPRSTPQLSYTLRAQRAHAGIVITASHNPPHDNGFKAYFDDGAQIVPPHDSAVVAEVGAVPLAELAVYLVKDLSEVVTLGAEADAGYRRAARSALIDPEVLRRTKLRVVFTNIHGTGAIASVPLLEDAGCEVLTVPEQLAFDARFPSVKSPNPENAEALSLGVALAEARGADVVMATDPDCDRMGVAVRNRSGQMELLTGNQIGALLADYRLSQYKAQGLIPAAGSERACLLKTFVTTGLQDAIGAAHGVKVVNTLTGFKWISAKLRRYEEQAARALAEATSSAGSPNSGEAAPRLDSLGWPERVRALQTHSAFLVLGSEESYGYMPNDLVRDKDGNTACLMFAELCAALKARGLTAGEALDELYLRHGFYLEGTINLYYEGASGKAKIDRILASYRASPPKNFGEWRVTEFEDFGRQDFYDADGERIPKQDLYFVTLSNGYRFAARGSGTEPKMKFYLFASEPVASAAELPRVKAETRATLAELSEKIEADARSRTE